MTTCAVHWYESTPQSMTFKWLVSVILMMSLIPLSQARSIKSIEMNMGLVHLSADYAEDWRAVQFKDDQGKSVTFSQTPIVVLSPLSGNGPHATTVRVRNVSTTGFEVTIDEWEYLDQWHMKEKLYYMAVEPGVHVHQGMRIVAAKVNEMNTQWKHNHFLREAHFSEAPVVLTQLVSDNVKVAATVRLNQVTKTGFKLRLQEQEANRNRKRNDNEVVDYIAMSIGQANVMGYEMSVNKSSRDFNHRWTSFYVPGLLDGEGTSFFANMQSFYGGDTATLRFKKRSMNSVDLRVHEDKSRDRETAHTTEVVGLVSVAKKANGANPSHGAHGADNANASHGACGSIEHDADLPPGIAMNIERDHQQSDRFNSRFNDRDQPTNASESAQCGNVNVVVNNGVNNANHKSIQFGTLQARAAHGQHWYTHTFSNDQGVEAPFASIPAVVISPLSFNGGQPANVRVRNVTEVGFEYKIDEWEYLDKRHLKERMYFFAVLPGVHTFGGVTVQAGSVHGVDKQWHRASFAANRGRSFTESPLVFTQQVSDNDRKATTVRIKQVTAEGFSLTLQEQERFRRQHHRPEQVDYIAFSKGIAHINGHNMSVIDTGRSLNHRWKRMVLPGIHSSEAKFLANMQSTYGGDTANLRYRQFTGNKIVLKIEEERSRDREVRHLKEQIGIVVVQPMGGKPF